jgi:hypothetical protein
MWKKSENIESKYSCSLYFEYKELVVDELAGWALNMLGFPPRVMSIYINDDEDWTDVSFDRSLLQAAIKKGFSSIQIMNKMYDEEPGYYWMRIMVDKHYSILNIEWRNSSLDFLLAKNAMTPLLTNRNFIFGYTYDADDSYLQSQENKEYFESKMPGKLCKTKKGMFGEDIIDTSDHWGRMERACGLLFIAGALMWFGPLFFTIIDKQRLLAFRYVLPIDSIGEELVFIQLFDIYDSPGKQKNRSRQEEFWKFFNLIHVMEKYRLEKHIDDNAILRNLILKGNAKKKK